MEEKHLQSKILWWLKEQGIYAVKVITSNRTGVPDILACIRGQFYAFEIKSEEGRLTDLQKLNIEQIKQAGGKAYVVRTYEEFKKIMSKLNGE